MNAPEEGIRVWRRIAAASALAGVVVLSLGVEVDPGSELMDRLAHASAYAVLTVFLTLLLTPDPREAGPKLSILAMGGGLVAFGTAIELAQGTVHRDADVADVVADAVGVGVVLVAYSLLGVLSHRRRNGGRRRATSDGDPGCSVRQGRA